MPNDILLLAEAAATINGTRRSWRLWQNWRAFIRGLHRRQWPAS